ncbi:hypothetical protein HPT29_003130 [Microvirga terrae]|uniref:Uncharacterized protein n=1 Tax=Microvirga terrae TaxID=2740529 RepID=A0ABY5RTP2_9HYPH|nr:MULTISPECIES: hypothetical protein [Microvirga]MBQ0822591.1 hypothetical protein [Microvirga sp. HBU67558]UVF20162.1 hypothetical protein HPT29_003130 [Microvirga terrae]
MHRLAQELSRGAVLSLWVAAGSAGAAPAVAERYAGSFWGTGTILEGPDASSHQVSCSFAIQQQGATSLALQGTCRAYLLIARSVSARLSWDPRSGQVTGTYTGSRVGTAQLRGRQVGTDFDLAIEWPRPLYGDTTAQMRVASLDPGRFRIVVTDRIGENGPVRATTDLTLVRQ